MQIDKPELEVTSLELAKQLKDAGYPQEGLWKWTNYGKDNWELSRSIEGIMTIDVIAPTVAELGERLPCRYESHRRAPNDWVCADNKDLAHFFADTEANARAEMWLDRKRKGLI